MSGIESHFPDRLARALHTEVHSSSGHLDLHAALKGTYCYEFIGVFPNTRTADSRLCLAS